MPNIRCFVALPTSSEVKDCIAHVQSQLAETHSDVKWDVPEKFHITLKFLGQVDETRISAIAERLRTTAESFQSFDLTFEGIGAFPSVARPRVIWAGARANETVINLQKAVEDVCSSLGFVRDERPFHAHVTLGRVKGSRGLHRLTEMLKSVTLEPIQARSSELALMKSDLKPGGSIYTMLRSFQFQP